MKLLLTTLSLLSLVSGIAQAVPRGKQIESMLHSPGARELMDEEVDSWSMETKTLHNDAVVGGTIVLHGTPSAAQRFNRGKLIRCDARMIGGGQFAATRNSCDINHPIYLPLSAVGHEQPTAVAPGFYVLGFENSIYPGFLQIKTGAQTVIDLQQIAIPAGATVKVYRDLSALTEQFKMYFTTYVVGQSVFKLAEYSFGDLYIKTFGTRDGATQLSYKTCEQTKLPAMTPKGARLCKAWNMGTFMTVSEMFDFQRNGSFLQYEVGQQGMAYPYPMGRLLVAKQTTSEIATFVNVLPGQYVVESNVAGKLTAKSTGPVGNIDAVNALAMNLGWMPAASKLHLTGNTGSIMVPMAIDPAADPNAPSAATLAAADDSGGDYEDPTATCGNARKWRTELRAYCSSDAQAGCSRQAAKVCEPMFD